MSKKQAMELIVEEYNRAMAAHGPFSSDMEGWAILKEELDELWDNIKRDEFGKMLSDEAKQVGAMALKFFKDKSDGLLSIAQACPEVPYASRHEGYAHILWLSELLWAAVKSDHNVQGAAILVGAATLRFLMDCCGEDK